MSDLPTPETDAASFDVRNRGTPIPDTVVMHSFAVNLERQRDEALKRLDGSERARASLSEACDFLQAKQRVIEQLARELRDALAIVMGDFRPYGSAQLAHARKASAVIAKAKEVLP
jgi:hypothetical protein